MGAQAVRLSNVDIDNALKNKDFEVLFQPVFDLGNGALARVETFVRWRHPKLGLLPPGAFISFFETQGRMSELTRYVLAHALKAYMDWRGPWPPGLSVNLALSDLSDDAFTTHFTKLLRDLDFPTDLVTLECPMPPVDMPIETAQAHFQRLGETGARLAIEVRGRANELLRSLDPFPFDEIKTGGSAILRFARTVRGPGLSAIADLLDVANEANAAITAVGVEDQASLAALRGLGFTAAQGNHLGKVGELKEFRPHRINEVRALLDLEPLSSENLTAMFRTKAPEAQPVEPLQAQGAASESEDALIERLNERVAQFDGAATVAKTDSDPEEEKKSRAREKAKALALAKRAKARAERKTAAIERAKSKAAAHVTTDITDISAEDTPPQAPRDMQERLNRAFTPDDAFAAERSAPQAAQAAPAETTAAIQPEQSIIERAMAQQQQVQKVAAQGGGFAAPATAAAQTQVQARAPSAPLGHVSMSIAASGAYFQPGIRVGSPALLGQPDKPIPSLAIELPSRRMPPKPRAAAPAVPAPEPTAAPKVPSVTVTPPASAPTAAAAQAPAPVPSQEVKTQPAKTNTAAPPAAAQAAEAPAQPEAASLADPAFSAHPPAPPAVERAVLGELLGDLDNDASGAETVDETAAEAPSRRSKPFLKKTVIPVSRHFWPKSWRRAWKRRQAALDAAREQREERRNQTQDAQHAQPAE